MAKQREIAPTAIETACATPPRRRAIYRKESSTATTLSELSCSEVSSSSPLSTGSSVCDVPSSPSPLSLTLPAVVRRRSQSHDYSVPASRSDCATSKRDSSGRNACRTVRSCPTLAPRFGAGGSNVRSRYLQRLGISTGSSAPTGPTVEPAARRQVLRCCGPARKELLKKDQGQRDESLSEDSLPLHVVSNMGKLSETSRSANANRAVPGDGGAADEDSTASTAALSTHSVVTFEPTVTVHPIPSRSQYSQRFRNMLWIGRKEQQSSIVRNEQEFIAEDRDWRKAVEEDQMVVVGNELVHPVHLQPSLQGHFLKVMAVQQFSF